MQNKDYRAVSAQISGLLRVQPWVWIAIDGRCASGKTTLAERLRADFDGNLFHMDDYFLPFARKTQDRLNEPGGNVDYERFYDEIILPGKGARVTYRPFDCVRQALKPAVTVTPKPLTIVEGSYSLHPTLRDAYDYAIFMNIDPELQMKRILARNGKEKSIRFQNEWIPLEEDYFTKLKIMELCGIAIDGGMD